MTKRIYSSDDLGTVMKSIETTCGGDLRVPDGLPFVVRLDGVGFSKFTRSFEKPFDVRLMDAMVYAAAKIVEDFQPALAYIQSDEVSFLFSGDVAPPMGGRVVKISSRFASQMTAWFVRELSEIFPKSLDKRHPHFDGRLSWFEDEETAAHNIQWREMDARKNAVSSAAAVVFSEPALRGKHTTERLRMLKDADVDFDSYPADFKSGVFLRRVTEFRELTEEELAPIPRDYWPTGPVRRTTIKMFNLPPLPKISNIVPVLFRGEEPVVAAAVSGAS